MPISLGVFEKLRLKIQAYSTARQQKKIFAELRADEDAYGGAVDDAVTGLNAEMGNGNGTTTAYGDQGSRLDTVGMSSTDQIYNNLVRQKIAERQSVARTYEQFRQLADNYDPAQKLAGYVLAPEEWRGVFRTGGTLDVMIELAFETGLTPTIFFITYPGSKKLKRVEVVYGSADLQIVWHDAS